MGNDGSTECLNFLLEARANRKAPKDVRFTPLPLVNTKCVFSSIIYIYIFSFFHADQFDLKYLGPIWNGKKYGRKFKGITLIYVKLKSYKIPVFHTWMAICVWILLETFIYYQCAQEADMDCDIILNLHIIYRIGDEMGCTLTLVKCVWGEIYEENILLMLKFLLV
jgi:hypothetical protein